MSRPWDETSREWSARRRGLGNSDDRRRRKEWLLCKLGDGERVACRWCGILLDKASLTVDRYPVPGRCGGTYRRDNVVPSCATCNSAREALELGLLAHEETPF